MEFYELIQEAFKEGDSIEALYEKWIETGKKARDVFVETSPNYEIISEFIDQSTEFIRSAKELYQNT
ncbi:hypothetical protein [Desulfonema magnum]|uniref:Uncharacterized protein n=1 Tax=Desulfonema magnum TaxID=45655 RepID=A0A975BPV2_9BACT|nr:hypothetical protein [Desulfonema magnum]QTA89491.1 Uncharacterized protein dnm_055470 [Desulfonema magnum]